MSLNTPIHTWSDGTPKSLTSPFNWQTEEHRAQKEKTEREREKWRVNYAKRKEREKAKATRVNPHVRIAAAGEVSNAIKNR